MPFPASFVVVVVVVVVFYFWFFFFFGGGLVLFLGEIHKDCMEGYVGDVGVFLLIGWAGKLQSHE